MFETNHGAARVAFGATLIVGAVLLVTRHQLPFEVPAAAIMLGSWLAAVLAGVIAGAVCTASPDTRTSIVVPSIGIALMLPLLLHLPFALSGSSQAYDAWVSLSIWVVGTAHLTLAALVALRGWQLATGRDPISILSIYGWVVMAGCIPLGPYVIPPVLVAITGVPFIALLRYQARLAARDRETTVVIPRAYARA